MAGVREIHYLLQRPNLQITAKVLDAFHTQVESTRNRTNGTSDDIGVGGSRDDGPRTDHEGKAKLKKKYQELKDEIEEAETNGDPARLQNLQEEMEKLRPYLIESIGRNGASRIGSQSELIAGRVRKRIERAIVHITAKDKPLGTHLRRCISKVPLYSYNPEEAVDWEC